MDIHSEGRYSSDNSSDSDNREDETTGVEEVHEKKRPFSNVSYDISLPVLHAYLGSNLEELSGRIVLEDNSFQTIPLLTLPGVILVPGQTLPLQLYHPATVSVMKCIIDSDRTFGLIGSKPEDRMFDEFENFHSIGTTAEIRSYIEERNNRYGLTNLRIKAEGRQRFQLLDTSRQSDGILFGKVRILPEINLGNPGDHVRLNSLDRFRLIPHLKFQDGSPKKISATDLTVKKHFCRYNFADVTHLPSFVYRKYDPEVIMQKIKLQLRALNSSLKLDYMPSGAREFSYWVAANLALDDDQKISLLSINNYIQRLQRELEILEQCSVLRCKNCNAEIADLKDIFSMSLHGPQGTYVNRNGYVHEAITLYKVKKLHMTGSPSTEQSWFPGYAWRICECASCQSHMGWKFISVDTELRPTKFWAICRASLAADKAMLSGDQV